MLKTICFLYLNTVQTLILREIYNKKGTEPLTIPTLQNTRNSLKLGIVVRRFFYIFSSFSLYSQSATYLMKFIIRYQQVLTFQSIILFFPQILKILLSFKITSRNLHPLFYKAFKPLS